ncbi:hypothetical protein [Bradyrhizobium japonicum]|uniref:hypothetical protein n=1 Tax=Bradyrhizobium japonicum TaxID=375 RepID=UPI00209E053A|nr:hypothetical protein [Bradyrhizobium japonicum]MCP1957756.1 hypothetical protein [Bradyrhizobium japonicum]
MIERDGGGVALRRDPFGIVGEECGDAAGIARRKGLPGVEDDVFRAGHGALQNWH